MKNSLSRNIFILFNTLFLGGLSLLCIYPVLYVLFASFSDSGRIMAHSGLLWAPLGFNWEAYRAVLKNPVIGSGYINTILVVGFGTLLNIVLTSLGAYFLSRKNVMLKNFIMIMIVITMFFSGGLIPFYLTVKNLGMYNTLLALIIPTGISTYNLIIMRTSFMAVPDSLEEAALIDGAGHFRVLTQVVIPLSKSIIAVMVLYYGVARWNEWFNAMIFLSDRSKFPLQLVLREILIQNDTQAMTQGVSVTDGISVAESVKYAVIIVATVPILCIYPFLQKYFVKGVMVGALKG
jgi:putative aldouronate transport system permease protein